MRIISEEGGNVKKGNKPWSIYPHWDANDYDENVAIKAEKTYLYEPSPPHIYTDGHLIPLAEVVTKQDTFKKTHTHSQLL